MFIFPFLLFRNVDRTWLTLVSMIITQESPQVQGSPCLGPHQFSGEVWWNTAGIQAKDEFVALGLSPLFPLLSLGPFRTEHWRECLNIKSNGKVSFSTFYANQAIHFPSLPHKHSQTVPYQETPVKKMSTQSYLMFSRILKLQCDSYKSFHMV
jgi:hypothetical protein